MSEVRYMISDAAKLVDVEAHVLRYWEEELELPIGRNEMSHRYYTEENIRLFRHIKELKEQGVQLKAIKMLIPDLEQGETEMTHLIARVDKFPAPADGQAAAREEKMQQFQCIMSRLISEAPFRISFRLCGFCKILRWIFLQKISQHPIQLFHKSFDCWLLYLSSQTDTISLTMLHKSDT